MAPALSTLSAVLAHGNGLDDALFVVAPVVIFGGLLAIANKRANAMHRASGDPSTPEPANDEGTERPE